MVFPFPQRTSNINEEVGRIIVTLIFIIISNLNKNHFTRLFCLFLCWNCKCCVLRKILVIQWNAYFYRNFTLLLFTHFRHNTDIEYIFTPLNPGTISSGIQVCDLEICPKYPKIVLSAMPKGTHYCDNLWK